MVLPPAELYQNEPAGIIFAVQAKVEFTAQDLFREVRGPVTFEMPPKLLELTFAADSTLSF